MFMPRRRTNVVAAAFVVLAALSGCGTGSDAVSTGPTTTSSGSVPDGPPQVSVPDEAGKVTGTITKVVPFVPVTEGCIPMDALDPDGSVSSDDPPVCSDANGDVLGTVMVEERPDDPGAGVKVSFTVRTSTVLLGADEVPLGGFAALAEGQVVEVWASGPCAESYPEQCAADVLHRIT